MRIVLDLRSSPLLADRHRAFIIIIIIINIKMMMVIITITTTTTTTNNNNHNNNIIIIIMCWLHSIPGSSVKLGTIQIILAWPLREDDTNREV